MRSKEILMPIGINDRMDNFTFHEIDIFKGDSFYLFTDGFPINLVVREIKNLGIDNSGNNY